MKNNRFLLIILALLLLLPLVSCGNKTPSSTEAPKSTAPVSTAPVSTEVSRENTPDKLDYDAIDYGGAEVNFLCREALTPGEVFREELIDEILNDAIYNRNKLIEDKLGIKIVMKTVGGNDASAKYIQTLAKSGAGDCDICGLRSYEAYGLITENVFYNLFESENLDLTAPWWTQGLIDATTIAKSKIYILFGSIGYSSIALMQGVFFNKSIYEEYIGGNPDELYQTVVDRKWTVDKLVELSKLVYNDLNSNGQRDSSDIFGYGASPCANQTASVNGVKIAYCSFNDDGYPEVTFNSTHTVDAIKALYDAMWNNEGAIITEPSQAGLNTLTDMFKNEKLMFYNLSVGELGSYRDMSSDYSVIPMPMLDEEQGEYCSQLSDGATSWGVPVSAPDFERACTVLEALSAESYRHLIPEYYESALKVIYSRDNYVSQMLDIISDTLYFDFMLLHGSKFENLGNFIPVFLLKKDSAGFSSEYEKVESKYKNALDELLEFYK